MLWGLILQGLILVQAVMGRLVGVEYHFNKAADGQWQLTQLNYTLTDKGGNIVDAVVTMLHHGLDFFAQLTLLMPATSSVTYVFNSLNP